NSVNGTTGRQADRGATRQAPTPRRPPVRPESRCTMPKRKPDRKRKPKKPRPPEELRELPPEGIHLVALPREFHREGEPVGYAYVEVGEANQAMRLATEWHAAGRSEGKSETLAAVRDFVASEPAPPGAAKQLRLKIVGRCVVLDGQTIPLNLT